MRLSINPRENNQSEKNIFCGLVTRNTNGWTKSGQKSLDPVSNVLDFLLLSLPVDDFFCYSDLESQENKICLEKLSTRSLRICNIFLRKK